jgi:hypothetical protein
VEGTSFIVIEGFGLLSELLSCTIITDILYIRISLLPVPNGSSHSFVYIIVMYYIEFELTTGYRKLHINHLQEKEWFHTGLQGLDINARPQAAEVVKGGCSNMEQARSERR